MEVSWSRWRHWQPGFTAIRRSGGAQWRGSGTLSARRSDGSVDERFNGFNGLEIETVDWFEMIATSQGGKSSMVI